eukprot:SAG25_NODE_13724_length_263_cov_1.475610_1_plen_41_part_01
MFVRAVGRMGDGGRNKNVGGCAPLFSLNSSLEGRAPPAGLP